MEEKDKPLQWHPAFFAGLQIEFEAEKDELIFENEHMLGTKPMQIDILIIKKQSSKPIEKNIGKIFKKYNIVEYKSPEDSFGIDDFYKIYGYAYIYKSNTKYHNEISINEITISLVATRYPRKLIKYLITEKKLKVILIDIGIYYVMGMDIPIQLIVLNRLPKDKNIWINSLREDVELEVVKKLMKVYNEDKDNNLYGSVLDIILRAKRKNMGKKEETYMCETFDLMLEEARVRVETRAWEKGIREGREAGLQEGREAGLQEGREAGIQLTIGVCKELGLSKAGAIKKIADKFNLSYDKSNGYVEAYWNQ